MGRATIGESGADKAMNRMEKHMERSARHAERNAENNSTPRTKENPIITQLKQLCPDTWKEELEEMRREHRDPDYLARKNAAKEQFKLDYYKMVPQHERQNMSESRYINKRLSAWKEENR